MMAAGRVEVRGNPRAVEHHVAIRDAGTNGPGTGCADEEGRGGAGPVRSG